jgi:hypothetical protein
MWGPGMPTAADSTDSTVISHSYGQRNRRSCDGEVLGVRLAHSHLPTRTTPGRGLLIRPGEEPILIQVPLLDPLEQPDQNRPEKGIR